MGLNFRKSIGFKGFRVNLSKGGIGLSAGVKGARVGINKRGVRGSVGANGVYYTKQKSWKSLNKDKGTKNLYDIEEETTETTAKKLNRFGNDYRNSVLETEGLEGKAITSKEKRRGIKGVVYAVAIIGSFFTGGLLMLPVLLFIIIDIIRTLKNWNKNTRKWVKEDCNSKTS